MEDLQPTQTEPVQLRRSERICQRAQQYIKEIPMSLFGEVLECNFSLIAFEIEEDNDSVHSTNLSIQNSDYNNEITKETAQESSLTTEDENNKKIKGEEYTLNEPQTYMKQ
jgi:hypothetical protein